MTAVLTSSSDAREPLLLSVTPACLLLDTDMRELLLGGLIMALMGRWGVPVAGDPGRDELAMTD